MKFSEFSYSRFTEALLSLLIIGYCVFALHAIHHGDREFGMAMLDNNKLVLGALLGMATAARIHGRQEDEKEQAVKKAHRRRGKNRKRRKP